MAALHLLILLQFILSLFLPSSGLMSNYKTCGDVACARLMCRVQALRDHRAQDCRFLSFKKGDMIDVYHKLSGRRNELWAGSRDKDFGYFPKDAVKIDEGFVDEKEEIEMRAQKTDFFCMDAFGTIIKSGEEFEDHENGAQTAESEELGNGDFDDRDSKSSETNENVETRQVDNNNKGKAEQRGTSWIGSAVSGWFANDADEEENENKEQENFKSRKLALDMEQLDNEERLELKDKTESDEDSPSEQVSYLLGDGTKSLVGFGGGGGGDTPPTETNKQTQDEDTQNPRKEQEATSRTKEASAETINKNERIDEKKSAGWYDSVYNTITTFYDDPAEKREASNDEVEESSIVRGTDPEEKNPEPRSESFLIQDSEGDRNAANEEKLEVSIQDDSGESSQLGDGWYGSVYSRITEFYVDTQDGKAAPDKSDVIDDSRRDSSSLTSEMGTGDPTAERKTESSNAGWYNSIYSRISNVYGDTSDRYDVPDVMKEGESQTQNEATKDTSSKSIFTMNGLSTVIDSLRGAESDDETTASQSVRSESSETQPCVSTDHSDDDGDAEDLGVRDRENSENYLSRMINGLKSPFKPNNAEDKEESDGEQTLDTGKEGQRDNEDKRDNDDELSVTLPEVTSEISTQGAAVISKAEEEESVVEVKVAEAQIHGVESLLDCSKQDTGGEDEKRDEFSDQSTRITSQSMNMIEEPEEPGWTDLPEHYSDTSKRSEGDTKTDTVNMLPEAGMMVRSSEAELILHKESSTKKHDVDVPQMESTGEKERGDATQIEYSEESQSVNITLLVEDKEREDADVTEMENYTQKDSDDVTPEESGGEKEDIDATRTETDGEKERLNITQMESGGEMEGEVKYSGEREHEDVAQMESAGEMEGEVKYSGEREHEDVAQMESAGENESIVIIQMEPGGDNTSGELTQVKNSGGQDGVDDSQNEADEQKESVNITQIEYEGEKGNDTQETSDREKEDINFTQMKSDEEREGGDKLSLHNTHGLENSHSASETKQNLEIDPVESRESEEPESAVLVQAKVVLKNVQDIPSPDSFISSPSDGDQNDSKKHGDKMMDVKHHKAQTSGQTQKPACPNLQAHLSEVDMQVLQKFFSEGTLSWLDFLIGHSEYINNEELAELHDFEQTLQNLLNTRNQEIKSSLGTTHTVLAMLRKKFRPVITDGSVDKSPDPSQTECVTETCVSTMEKAPMSEQDMGKDINMETGSSTDDSESSNSKSHSNDQEVNTDRTRILDTLESDQKTAPHLDSNIITEEFLEPEESQNTVLRLYTALAAKFTSDVITFVVKESVHVTHSIHQVVMSLPDEIRPGPDLYGVPWEAVIFTVMLGLFTFLLFTCRFLQAVKSRLYCSKERRMGQKVAELLEEKCKVLETLSECEHKFKKLDAVLQDGELSAQASEKKDLEAMSKKLEETNVQMQSDLVKMQEELDTQEQLRKQQEEQLTNLEEMLKKLEQDATERKSQLEQDKMTLKIHKMNTERLQKKLQEAKEENSMLLESKAQLEQEAEGWRERLSELEEEKRMCETSHNGMMENCVNKDERIKSLTECLLKMRDWDSEEESTVNDSSDFRQKQKVQKLINAATMSADLKAMEEDKDRMFAKLTDEIKAKEDLQEGLDQLQREKVSLESESSMYSSEIEKLQHKLQIMSEMYQEKELKLHRMLTVEEKERSQKEEQLNKAGKKISLATDELNSYRQRAKELEEELEKTNQAYRNQIAAHEKKAHDNWLAARAADRDLTDVKRENSVLRQRLTDWQFKLELMEKNPQARVPLFRGERSPFGPSPLGRPPSETRPFLSPPTLMDGPSRVSPQFPMMPSGRAPPGGMEGDRSVSYSEGGSPTWERERERRSLGPPGPDPGLLYRRPLSAPFLRAPLPPEAYYNDKSESSFGGEGAGFSENGSGRSMPAAADIRAGPLPPPQFPPADPRDPHFPRRSYRPDFFPPPPLTMRGPPPPLPPGVFPRIPLPPLMAFPPMRPPTDHVSPEPPSRPSPPGSEQPAEQPPPGQDII
ncbi:cTAGE family member 5 isoform X3 [Tachysurus vachellii]|uniref:cTAGE family member 5 isoform X3 n=1 Tax=Tachysurus vachellii TaxID=175792 RepID=UPI00296AF455|nr:cTAGE family member 5 isoform X3 [Tachysurus vachellii]